jgi:multidrug efflux system membrane fusion protein
LPQIGGGRARALKVQAVPAGSADTPVTGTVSFVDNTVDQATDSVRVKAMFTNRDRRLWAGAFVDVTLQLAVERHAVVVPNASVQASQQGQFVYVVKADNTVEARPVKVGWIDRDEAVVESGVKAGETVVTDGQLRLTPGAKVSAKPAEGQSRTTS